MSEKQGNYKTEMQDALEMLGKGYEPTLEIESPHKVTERRGGQLVETERPAFVKIYTTFKDELKELDGDDLKVWLYLALSVNRYTNEAHPGLRRISDDIHLAIGTVRLALDRLEERGLLDIEKAEGRTNLYRPSDYVSVSKLDTVPRTVSKKVGTVSKKVGTVSTTREDSAQLEELDEPEDIYKPDPVFLALENLTGGLNTDTPRFVDTWREKHDESRIMQAIELAQTKGRKPVQYVDAILMGWESNGYPKTREEKVQERKTKADDNVLFDNSRAYTGAEAAAILRGTK
jgi:DNA-binding transcriptional ArsR family regulator